MNYRTQSSPIALYRRLGRSLFFGRRLVDSSTRLCRLVDSSTHRLVDSIHPQIFFYIYDLLWVDSVESCRRLSHIVSSTRLYLGQIHCIDSLTHHSIDSTSRYHWVDKSIKSNWRVDTAESTSRYNQVNESIQSSRLFNSIESTQSGRRVNPIESTSR